MEPYKYAKQSLVYILALYLKFSYAPFALAVIAYALTIINFAGSFSIKQSLSLGSLMLLLALSLQFVAMYVTRCKAGFNWQFGLYLACLQILCFSFLTWRYFNDLTEQRQLIEPYISNYNRTVSSEFQSAILGELKSAKRLTGHFYHQSLDLAKQFPFLQTEKWHLAIKTKVLTTSLLQTRQYGTKQCIAQTPNRLRLQLVFPNSSFSKLTTAYLKAGDYLEVQGSLEAPPNALTADGFDARRYLASKGIYLILQVKSWKTIDPSQLSWPNRLLKSLVSLQNMHYYWQQLLRHSLNEEDAGLAQAVSLANGNYLAKRDKSAFQTAGIIHALVASGQHVNYLLALIFLLVEASPFTWYKRQILALCLLAFLACFYLTEIAFWRAILQYVLLQISHLSGRNLNKFKLASLANFFLLAWQPYLISNISFHLSLLACLTLYCLQVIMFRQRKQKANGSQSKLIANLTSKSANKARRYYPHSLTDFYRAKQQKQTNYWYAFLKNLMNSRISQASLIVLVIQLVYSLFNLLNDELSLAKILANSLILPILVYLALLFNSLNIVNALAYLCSLPIYRVIGELLKFSLDFLRQALAWVNCFSSYKVSNKQLFSAGLMLMLTYLFRQHYIAKLPIKRSVFKWRFISLLSLAFCLGICYLFNLTIYSLHFLAVGQGDACVIQYWQALQKHYCLIDGGEAKNFSTIRDFMQAQAVRTFDLAIISHFDSDHYGGIFNLAKAGQVKAIICSKPLANSEKFVVYQELSTICQAKQIELVALPRLKLDRLPDIVLNKRLKLHFIQVKSYSEQENDYSLGLYLSFNKQNIALFTGDISKEAENDWLAHKLVQAAPILKVAHHGSKGSTCDEFLDCVRPKLAVISCAFSNTYRHPRREVIDRLNRHKVFALRTDLQGKITIKQNIFGRLLVRPSLNYWHWTGYLDAWKAHALFRSS